MASRQLQQVGSLRGAALRNMPVPPLVHQLKLYTVNNLSVPTLEMVYQSDPHLSKRVVINDSDQAYRTLLYHYRNNRPPHPAKISILLLNSVNKALGLYYIDPQQQHKALIDPFHVFAPAFRAGAARVIIGNFTIRNSVEPLAIERTETAELVKLGHKMVIDVIDHILYNECHYYSFAGHDQIRPDYGERPYL